MPLNCRNVQQPQRWSACIAIARTVLANPRLLVMDEATSALDYNTDVSFALIFRIGLKDEGFITTV